MRENRLSMRRGRIRRRRGGGGSGGRVFGGGGKWRLQWEFRLKTLFSTLSFSLFYRDARTHLKMTLEAQLLRHIIGGEFHLFVNGMGYKRIQSRRLSPSEKIIKSC